MDQYKKDRLMFENVSFYIINTYLKPAANFSKNKIKDNKT